MSHKFIHSINGVLMKYLSQVFPSQSSYNFEKAQKFELESAEQTIKEHFEEIYEKWELAKNAGSLWQGPDDLWFKGNQTLWDEFANHARGKKCLEIGSGPFGYLAPCYWIKDRVIIDPLIDFYREHEIKISGKTFFTDDIVTYNKPAEDCIDDLIGKVDGFIVCQNALDHSEDPLSIMHNISEYAAPGCYLLIWTDIWHLQGLDAGHRNITKNSVAFDKVLMGMGFEIIQTSKNIRDQNEYIEYGRIAVKK
jgi:hypothetical protein